MKKNTNMTKFEIFIECLIISCFFSPFSALEYYLSSEYYLSTHKDKKDKKDK